MRTLTPEELASHTDRIAEQGWTVVEDAIEPDLADELTDALDRLERDLAVAAENTFGGTRTACIYNLLVHGDVFAGCPSTPTCCRSWSEVLDPRVACCRRCRRCAIGPDETPSRSTPTTSSSPSPSPTHRCATRCGR